MSQPTQAAVALDAEELLRLAVVDSREGRHDSAILKLKQALLENPDHAGVLFFLAAEHAEIGLFDRAIEGMQAAIERAPRLYTAHLQLGLIYFTQNRISEARAAWRPLEELGDDNVLALFTKALMKLSANAPEEALSLLQKSAQAPNDNEALAQDIQRVMANVKRHLEQSETPVGTASADHLLVHRYGDAARDES